MKSILTDKQVQQLETSRGGIRRGVGTEDNFRGRRFDR